MSQYKYTFPSWHFINNKNKIKIIREIYHTGPIILNNIEITYIEKKSVAPDVLQQCGLLYYP